MKDLWGAIDARRRSRGIALLAVIWVVTLLSAIATSMVSSTRTESVITRNRLTNAKAEALADAALYRILPSMLRNFDTSRPLVIDPGPATITTPDAARLLETLRGAGELLSQADQVQFDGRDYVWPFADGVVLISVVSESGKIDLNAADATLLASLMRSAGESDPNAETLADAVIDFRDADSNRRPNGAEDVDYRARGLGHEAKDRPFEIADEVLQVAGMTRALYDDIAPALTVYSGAGGINPAFAPARALRALPDIGEQQISETIAMRAVSEPRDVLNSFGPNPYVSAASTPVFTIRAEAHVATGGVFVRESIVSFRAQPGAPFQILTWRQGRTDCRRWSSWRGRNGRCAR